MSVIRETGEEATTERLARARLVCEVVARFTKVVDYGIRLDELTSGRVAVPPAGARFDITFEGTAHGPGIDGAVTGTDYLTIRADGRSELHIHGCVEMLDGARISFFNEGAGKTGAPLCDVFERVQMYSAAPEYTWVNGLAAWGIASVNAMAGEIRATIHTL